MKRKRNFNRERERKGRRGGRIERNTSERICRFWCGSRQLSSNKIKAVVIKKITSQFKRYPIFLWWLIKILRGEWSNLKISEQ